MSRVARVGHRGACGHRLENSESSFRKALELGCDMVEFDVRLTADGVPVVMHDATLKRTTGQRGVLREIRYADLPPLLDGSAIPTLAGTLALLTPQAVAMIEVKEVEAGEAVAVCVRQALEQGMQPERCIISSFHAELLAYCQKHLPQIPRMLLFKEAEATMLEQAKALDAAYLGLLHTLAKKEVIALAHAAGLKVHGWTANEVADIERLIHHGADGVISDYPERVGSLQ